MIDFTLAGFLGAPVNALLAVELVSGWDYTRTEDLELPTPEIWYVFDGRGFEVMCDEHERITTIFLMRGDGVQLSSIPFTASRAQVWQVLGVPERSGPAALIPLLGHQGAWDRFWLPAAALRIQYCLDRDEIEQITLMRHDVVPDVHDPSTTFH